MATSNYLVLARQWRPRTFETLVGQEHVVKALSNALSTQRLHHAWLFTGTRGVGKTTLARILAKSLNCETGITPHPCGVCQACVEIDQGRFVDYLEFDAASNRRVEEMTQLLEQAIYAPSVGRFKIYTIDEVHMLTGHAFNAMLKTLEEPPPHVKFILATTDPQKIPVTVLSRCLQFNLKQMTPDAIVGHLQSILTQEAVQYEDEGLRLLAQAAAGSMRDALSLTDQAIAYSGAQITAETVRDMLGTIDQRYLIRFLQSLCAGNAQGIMDVAIELSSRGFSFSRALEDLASLLSTIAIEQRLPDAISAHHDEERRQLAQALSPDVVQLLYSVAIHSRAELALSPDEYTGFVMAGLRMLSLIAPLGVVLHAPPLPPQDSIPAQKKTVLTAEPPLEPQTVTPPPPQALPKALAPEPVLNTPETPPASPHWEEAYANFLPPSEDDHGAVDLDPSWVPQEKNETYLLSEMTPERWVELAPSFQLTGMAGELTRHTEWVGVEKDTITLRLLIRIPENLEAKTKLNTVLTEYFKMSVKLNIEFGQTEQTAFASEQLKQAERQQKAEKAVQDSELVQALQRDFDARLLPNTIRPLSP